jgi:hypothetical protein
MEYWDQGVTVGIVNETDTKRIYEFISNHLLAWKQILDTGLNTRGAPLEDLVKLDQFANAVYRHARYQFTQEYVDSVLGRTIDAIPHARHNVMKPFVEVMRINAVEEGRPEDAQKALEEQYPDRVSLADAFTRGQRNGGVKPGFSWRR